MNNITYDYGMCKKCKKSVKDCECEWVDEDDRTIVRVTNKYQKNQKTP